MSEYDSSSTGTTAEKKTSVWKIIFTVLLIALIGFLVFYGVKSLYEKYSPAYSEGGVGGVAKTMGGEISGTEEENTLNAAPAEAGEPAAVPVNEQAAESTAPDETPSVLTTSSSSDRVALTEEQIFERTVNSVVSISTEITGYNYFGQRVQGAARGSGFIVTADGYILTNYHVVEDSSAIKVYTYSGEEYSARVIGYDSSNDIAVLKIDAQNLTPVTIGDSDTLKEGQHVVAIGNALGEFGFSITEGIVSGLARDVQVTSDLTMSLIQTDCTVNSGNSGGPLFNMYGEVIGIVNAKLGSSNTYSSTSIDNIGFAIPINTVHQIVLNIIEEGSTASSSLGDVADDNTPFLGISGTDVDEFTLKATGLPGGAKIVSVYDGSAAAKAGMQADDIITKINGKSIENFEDLANLIAKYGIGDEIEFTIYRSGKELTVKATLTAKSDVDLSSDENQMTEEQQNTENQNQNQNPWGNSDDFDDFSDFYDYIFGNN